MTNSVVGVDREIACVDIVSLQYLLKNFRLMNGTFFHKVDDLILLNDGVLGVVVKLNLDLIL